MNKHAREIPESRSRADVWFVLVITGGTSATLQMWHATHAAGTVLLIAALVGLVPAATAVGLSHVVASHKSVLMLRAVTFAVMLAVMAASASAAAAVVRPIDGPWFSWVLCIALDAAALACVWVLLGDDERKAAQASALHLAETRAADAGSAAAEATGKVAALEAKAAAVSADLTAANATVEALTAAARGHRPKGSGAPRKNARGGGDAQDLTAELRAIQMLDAHPELRAKGHAAELARKLGISASHGRRLHSRLTAEERPAEPGEERAHERKGARDDERSGERPA
jgi:hypothetical protein